MKWISESFHKDFEGFVGILTHNFNFTVTRRSTRRRRLTRQLKDLVKTNNPDIREVEKLRARIASYPEDSSSEKYVPLWKFNDTGTLYQVSRKIVLYAISS